MGRIALLSLFLSITATAGAATITFNNFSDLSDFTLNGSAAPPTINNPVNNGTQDVLRLTDALSQGGSAFLTNPVSLAADASFSSAFQFQITDPEGISDGDGQGADGIVFVVQTVANNVGGGGGGIGYEGIPQSVGVEFDSWNNGGIDAGDGNHVGIDFNGNMTAVVQTNIDPVVVGRLNNGEVWSAWVDYNGVTNDLEVRLSTNGIRPVLALASINTDLVSVLGTTDAFVGFTSGTGAAGGDHDILNWTFVNTFAPIGVVPEPATLALFALGSSLAAWRLRRKKV